MRSPSCTSGTSSWVSSTVTVVVLPDRSPEVSSTSSRRQPVSAPGTSIELHSCVWTERTVAST